MLYIIHVVISFIGTDILIVNKIYPKFSEDSNYVVIFISLNTMYTIFLRILLLNVQKLCFFKSFLTLEMFFKSMSLFVMHNIEI